MAAVSPDFVQDVAFGVATAVGGLEIVLAAIKKQIASALTFLVTAIGVYGTFYL